MYIPYNIKLFESLNLIYLKYSLFKVYKEKLIKLSYGCLMRIKISIYNLFVRDYIFEVLTFIISLFN